jgi:hypothetical protein
MKKPSDFDKMIGRRSIIVVEDFYSDPAAVREYALRQKYYMPYAKKNITLQGEKKVRWLTSWYKEFDECPFKSSGMLIRRLEDIVGEKIDLEHWNGQYPVDEHSIPQRGQPPHNTCLWNCGFHVKLDIGQQMGGGVHNHVTDIWNSVGYNGWAGLIYLVDGAPIDGGLNLWKNINPENTFDWMSSADNWIALDRFANLYNRLVLVRGNIPHSGANGWGDSVENGRMFQTFFFKTKSHDSYSVDMTRENLAKW